MRLQKRAQEVLQKIAILGEELEQLKIKEKAKKKTEVLGIPLGGTRDYSPSQRQPAPKYQKPYIGPRKQEPGKGTLLQKRAIELLQKIAIPRGLGVGGERISESFDRANASVAKGLVRTPVASPNPATTELGSLNPKVQAKATRDKAARSSATGGSVVKNDSAEVPVATPGQNDLFM